MKYTFHIVDVFSSFRSAANQLAVLPLREDKNVLYKWPL